MATFDAWTDSPAPVLYGALSTGTVWQFLRLDRAGKRFAQNVALFRVPQDLASLIAVLMGVLEIA